MNDRAERGMLEFKMDAAQMYTIHKGRMPHDVHELREWLREFADLESKRADLTLRAYEQHADELYHSVFRQLDRIAEHEGLLEEEVVVNVLRGAFGFALAATQVREETENGQS